MKYNLPEKLKSVDEDSNIPAMIIQAFAGKSGKPLPGCYLHLHLSTRITRTKDPSMYTPTRDFAKSHSSLT